MPRRRKRKRKTTLESRLKRRLGKGAKMARRKVGKGLTKIGRTLSK